MHVSVDSKKPLQSKDNHQSEKIKASQNALEALQAVLPGYANLLRKKKIRRKGGSELEEYVPHRKQMEKLQHNRVLSDKDKQMLKESQLRYEVIEYKPKEESDGESDAESVDSLDENGTNNSKIEDNLPVMPNHSSNRV